MTGDYFLGVALTDDARRAVQACIASVELPGRVVASVDWHLTVRYLGATQPGALASLREALRTADLGPDFPLTFGGLGVFPDAKVLWLGLSSGKAGILALATRANAAVRQAGLPDGYSSFVPHVTLSRFVRPTDTQFILERFPAVEVEMVVDSLVLFRSGGGSPRYVEVERHPLGRG